mmetsp:Transcript_17908/g.26502  ORF Transcript_17908/g.26502 Transcript_17908/m.26502 type:complete len:433 (+) Transcript_17908:62-1360(+)
MNEEDEKEQPRDEHDTGDTSKEQELECLTGAESFLVGLCPHYWAHVPLCIADIHNLKLVNGIDCLDISASSDNNQKFIPVSKCLLGGIIVSVHPKHNNSTLYLLDDGTGLMDCLEWGQDVKYQLPSSLLSSTFETQWRPKYLVGDLVQIWGKIRVVRLDSNGGNAVREIRVIRMEHARKKKQPPREYDASWQCETRHVRKLCDWHDQYNPLKSPGNSTKVISTPKNSVDMLRFLGPTLTKQILNRLEWPSPQADSAATWRVFGPSCRCILPNNMKEELLYCWCQATREPRDSEFKFREALLCYLLRRQEGKKTMTQQEPLCFAYQSILNDKELQTLTKQQITSFSVNGATNSNYQSLVQKTVAALRQDGILFLVNRDSDEYLLVSRSRVLEPMLRNKKQWQSKKTESQHNRLWQFVPKSRIHFIQSCGKKEE